MRASVSAALMLQVIVGCVTPNLGDRAGRSEPVTVGDAVPVTDVSPIDGRARPLVQPDRVATLVVFWATWCRRCRAEMPALNRFHDAQRPSGIEVVGVNAGETRRRVEAFLSSRPQTFPIVLDPDGELTATFGVRAVPSMVLVDTEGRVRSVSSSLETFRDGLESIDLIDTGGTPACD